MHIHFHTAKSEMIPTATEQRCTRRRKMASTST
jgi:hypothetical protein